MKLTLLFSNPQYRCLMLSIGFATLLLLFRCGMARSFYYTFLAWNLFLAAVPFLVSQIMVARSERRPLSRPWFAVGFVLWLLFFPNSPYIITDLVHLHDDASHLVWLDLFLVFVFALNGLLLGLLSLMDMYRLIQLRADKRIASLTLFLVCFLGGYGIYVGRFLRFNSWDIIANPLGLFYEIARSLQGPKTWLMTFAFGGFLWILFLLMRSVSEQNTFAANRVRD